MADEEVYKTENVYPGMFGGTTFLSKLLKYR